jgi:thiopurine S-methyltransferase
MDAKFWLNKWSQKEIGFHYNTPNKLLTSHFEKMRLKRGDSIFVPLCGKTADLRWLMHQGVKVVGVELSKTAIEEFFLENKLAYQSRKVGTFTVYFNEQIEIYHGDFFNFQATTLLHFSAIFDRASLVALPKEMRAKYYTEIKKLLNVKGRYFLISYEYDQSKRDGPPFCVCEDEIISSLDLKLIEKDFFKDIKMSDRTNVEFISSRYLFEK